MPSAIRVEGAATLFTDLEATNFKSWKELPSIQLAPITGFFGSNSSGKTSLIQLFLLLKQTSASTDRLQPLQFGESSRSFVDLGSFRDVVHGHDVGETLTIGLGWNLTETLDVPDPLTENLTLFNVRSLQYRSSIQGSGDGSTSISELSYIANEGEVIVEMRRSSTRHGRKDPEYQLSALVNEHEYLRRVAGRPWPLPAPVKSYGFPDEAFAYFQNSGFISDFELAFDRQFSDNTYYLGPLRSYPARQYRWQGGRPEDVGQAGERAVEALLSTRSKGRINARAFDARGHARKRITVEQHVAEWLKELGLISDFSVDRLSEDADVYRVFVQRTASSSSVLLTDVGFGVSQILPVLVLLAYVPEGSTVILEQPEIHLHPAVQAGLADVIVEAATVRKVQVIVESHSEHLLRRLQLRTAQGRLQPKTVALYFCDFIGDHSQITGLELNLFGEIENWPPGFFGNTLEETVQIAKNGLRRRLAKSSE